MGASAFLLPLMLQLAFGLDALQSGLLTFAGALGAFAVKPLARGILHRFGFRRLLLVNGVLASLVLLAYALFTPATPHLVIIGVLLCGGFLRSLQFTSLSAITYAEVESRQVGSATSMASVAQQVSVSFGVAVGAMVVEMSEALRGHATPQTDGFRGGVRGGRSDVDDFGSADAAAAGGCGGRDLRPVGAGGRAFAGAGRVGWGVVVWVGAKRVTQQSETREMLGYALTRQPDLHRRAGGRWRCGRCGRWGWCRWR